MPLLKMNLNHVRQWKMRNLGAAEAVKSIAVEATENTPKAELKGRRYQNTSQSVDIPSISHPQPEDKRL